MTAPEDEVTWKARLPNGVWLYADSNNDTREGIEAKIAEYQRNCDHGYNLNGRCQLGCGKQL